MTIKVKSVSELNSLDVQSNQALMSQIIGAAYPELDTSRGVIHDVICFLAGGVVNGVTQTELQRVYDSRSLLAVKADPTKYDADVLDNILSNFFIERNAASTAVGNITVVISDNVTTVIPSGDIWAIGGLQFKTIYSVVARVTGTTIIAGNDRAIFSRGDGTYEFTIPVIAVTAGSAGNMRAGLTAVPASPAARFVKAYTSEDFTGGADSESVDKLIDRVIKGIPAPVAAGGSNLQSMLRRYGPYPTAEFSIVGFGNRAQLRDKRSLFPIATGGKVDVYARTAVNTITINKRKQCVLQEVLGPKSSLWSAHILKTDFPGFYRALSASNSTTNVGNSFPIESTLKSINLEDYDSAPDIQNNTEGAFSAFQTATLTFIDTLTDTSTLTPGDTAYYSIALNGQPGIAELQQVVSDSAHRMWSGDVLIKAAVPAEIFIDISVDNGSVSLSDADKQIIQAAAASAATPAGFPGKVYLSDMIRAAATALPIGTQLRRLSAYATVLQTDGTELHISNSTELTIPDLPDQGVTAATVGFFCHPSNVSVSTN